MSEEDPKVEIVEGEILEIKNKIKGLKKDIKDATGPEASKAQASAQESINKLGAKLKEKEAELEGLTASEVTEKEVLQMIEVAATVEEVDGIEGDFQEEIPDDIKKALENRKKELSAEPANLKQYPELRWKKVSAEEVTKIQKEDLELLKENPKALKDCRLVGYDEKKGIALIKPKKK